MSINKDLHLASLSCPCEPQSDTLLSEAWANVTGPHHICAHNVWAQARYFKKKDYLLFLNDKNIDLQVMRQDTKRKRHCGEGERE